MFQSFFKCINDLSQIDAAELVLRRLGRPVDLTRLVVPVNGKMGFKKSLRGGVADSLKMAGCGQMARAKRQVYAERWSLRDQDSI